MDAKDLKQIHQAQNDKDAAPAATPITQQHRKDNEAQ